ncbi:MAG: hypothetical protein LBQ52_02335 [Helicobacteraceae bacterium]|jgi:hypothetical protein|nr:hypothetical protein [Helicobacteraceae bacterium]
MGNVSGSTNVGGIAGYVYASTIENNAAINREVNGSFTVNRIVGYGDATVQNNFALVDMTNNGAAYSGSDNDQNGASKVIANFKT